jgi:hypothetical protein
MQRKLVLVVGLPSVVLPERSLDGWWTLVLRYPRLSFIIRWTPGSLRYVQFTSGSGWLDNIAGLPGFPVRQFYSPYILAKHYRQVGFALRTTTLRWFPVQPSVGSLRRLDNVIVRWTPVLLLVCWIACPVVHCFNVG